MTSESVEKGSGRNWDQWIAILNKAGAKSWTHQEIVAYLKKKYKLGSWWQQGVAYGFQVATGKRVQGQSLKGDYGMTATKSISRSALEVWNFLWSPKGLTLWLNPMSEFEPKKGASFEVEGGVFGEVRTVKAGVRARMSWQETEWLKPSILQLQVIPRGKGKCMVLISHGGFNNTSIREQMRERWTSRLEAVRNYFR